LPTKLVFPHPAREWAISQIVPLVGSDVAENLPAPSAKADNEQQLAGKVFENISAAYKIAEEERQRKRRNKSILKGLLGLVTLVAIFFTVTWWSESSAKQRAQQSAALAFLAGRANYLSTETSNSLPSNQRAFEIQLTGYDIQKIENYNPPPRPARGS
jgi:type II secretory pathway component PulM